MRASGAQLKWRALPAAKPVPEEISHSEGRGLFGLDPEGYDAARPNYPAWIFDELQQCGALFEGANTVEIGAGTGLASRQLIERGASPLTLIEPDTRFSETLNRATSQLPKCRVIHTSFEEAELAPNEFDLAVAATSFHWIAPDSGMRKLRSVVKGGGTAALIWNVFQVLDKPDPFHEATQGLLSSLAVTPSGAPNTVPFALDRPAREADARRGGFHAVTYAESRWSFQITTEQVGKLYEGFSQIQRLDHESRARILDELRRIADTQFGGVVERNVTSCLYRLS